MGTELLEKPGETAFMPRPRRWTNADFECMIKIGLFHEKRAELIDGEIIEISPMREPHAHSLALTHAHIALIFPLPEWIIRNQSPFFVGEGYRPEPDLAVVRRADLIAGSPPSSASLIIEISDSTLRYDRTDKASLYARAGVEDYWIVNVAERVLEVRRAPRPDATARFGFGYGSLQTLGEEARIAPLCASDGAISVGDLLG